MDYCSEEEIIIRYLLNLELVYNRKEQIRIKYLLSKRLEFISY